MTVKAARVMRTDSLYVIVESVALCTIHGTHSKFNKSHYGDIGSWNGDANGFMAHPCTNMDHPLVELVAPPH